MSSRGVAPSNDAPGGAQQRNLYPPGVGGRLVGQHARQPPLPALLGQIKSAPTTHPNIGIPYHWLVPLNNSNKLIGVDENGKTVTRRENGTRAPRLSLIRIRGTPSRRARSWWATSRRRVSRGTVAYQPSIMPAMVA